MDVKEAVRNAALILNEERQRPTIRYLEAGVDWMKQVRRIIEGTYDGATVSINGHRFNLTEMRRQSKRIVLENPAIYELSGGNFVLLQELYGQVHEDDRDEFLDALLSLVEHGGYSDSSDNYHYPTLEGQVSDLPLIAEFMIRTGCAERLFAALGRATVPTIPLALLMLQVEETISLNFTLFSRSDYDKIPGWLGPVREMADRQTHSACGDRGKPQSMVQNPHYKPGHERLATQIVNSVDCIFQEIGQAKFLYLKGALQHFPNLEVENDKVKVEGFLVSMGFDSVLIASLRKSEELYRATSEFDLKSCLGHLRSFFEHLHVVTANAISAQVGETAAQEIDAALNLLRNQAFLTAQQEKFARGLYTLISNEGVHALITPREFARLQRNMVIEYGFMFLTMLDKKGVKIRHQ